MILGKCDNMGLFQEFVEHSNRAVINWCFDDGNGYVDDNLHFQMAVDFAYMGKAYIANCLISVSAILLNDTLTSNTPLDSDTLVFPCVFNLLHGVELCLKSIVLQLSSAKIELKHELEYWLHKINKVSATLNINYFGFDEDTEVAKLIKEIEEKKICHTAFRYTYNIVKRNKNYELIPQFYNRYQADKKIETMVYVDILYLYNLAISCLNELSTRLNLLIYAKEDNIAITGISEEILIKEMKSNSFKLLDQKNIKEVLIENMEAIKAFLML